MLARDHKDQALQNAQLTGKNAGLTNQNSMLEVRLAQMNLLLAQKDCPNPKSGSVVPSTSSPTQPMDNVGGMAQD